MVRYICSTHVVIVLQVSKRNSLNSLNSLRDFKMENLIKRPFLGYVPAFGCVSDF